MGTRQLHEILSERMTISGSMQVELTLIEDIVNVVINVNFSSEKLLLDEATEAWGIKVERVEV